VAIDVGKLTQDETKEMLRECIRALALTHHPDKGGDQDKWQDLCLARENALRDLQESA
jgi:hypothetical protein